MTIVEALLADDSRRRLRTAAYWRGVADAYELDARALDDFAEALPHALEEYGVEGVCAELRLGAGCTRALLDQLRAEQRSERLSAARERSDDS